MVLNRWGGMLLCLTVILGLSHAFAEAKNSEYDTVIVKKGDTVYQIAKSYGTDVQRITDVNQLKDPSLIRVGQELRIPKTKTEKNEQVKPASQETKRIGGGEGELAIPAIARGRSLGEFTLTAYTAGPESTGKSPGHPAYGITSSGAKVREGVTVAVDPKVIPTGSRIYIEGIGYRVAQDTGSAIKGKRIDVFINDLDEALRFGVKRNVRVELVE